MRFLLLMICLLSAPAFGADRVLLTCPMMPGHEHLGSADIRLVREGDMKTFLTYTFEGESKRTKIDQISGSEYMGNEGKYLVFFEYFKSENRYLFSMIDTDTYKATVNQKLDCRLGE